MKTLKIAVAASVAAAVFAAPALVSAQDASLLEKAKQSCTQAAEAKGYKLNNIDSSEATADGGVKVRLDLTKTADNTKAKLTCNLGKDGKVAFGDGSDAMAATETAASGIAPWLWVLLPLIGLPLLLAWARGRQTEGIVAASDRTYERQEATIRANSDNLDIYSGPGTTYRVNGNLQNGERVVLTGRRENNWAELESGGWIPAQYLEGATRYVR